jgi:hypothetical protein
MDKEHKGMKTSRWRFKKGEGFFIILFLLLFPACQSLPFGDEPVIRPLPWDKEDSSPQRVVILPFENLSTEADLGLLVRKSFYNHFSSKNYHDFELEEVDRALKILEQTSSRPWKELPPPALGDFFHADFLIYGKVEWFDKLFLGIYSQIALEVDMKMIKTSDQRVVWTKTITKRSHDGGIPFDLFGIIPATIRSGFHMQNERTLDLIDRINREFVADIPNPPSPPISASLLEIQVASFKEKERAMKILKEFEGKGFKPWIEAVSLGDALWHRVMLGPYYNLPAAEKDRNMIAKDSPFQPIIIPRKIEKQMRSS